MYTIGQASRLSGVPEATLRVWERRYAVVTPARNRSGYRMYDRTAIATVLAMRRLVDAGWAPAEAARAAREEVSTAGSAGRLLLEEAKATRAHSAETCRRALLRSAAALDLGGIERTLDLGFALGTFEEVVDSWLMPTLVSLGDHWAAGRVDVAGEHAVSNAAHRRLASAFEAAGRRFRGPRIVVGLPTGSRHELGALAFATAARRLGHDVLYLGADVPAGGWVAAAQAHEAVAVVIGVVMAADRRPASLTVQALLSSGPSVPLVFVGGRHGRHLHERARDLSVPIAQAADDVDAVLYAGGEPADGRRAHVPGQGRATDRS